MMMRILLLIIIIIIVIINGSYHVAAYDIVDGVTNEYPAYTITIHVSHYFETVTVTSIIPSKSKLLLLVLL